MKNHETQPIQTLRLSDRDKARLLAAIEKASKCDPFTGHRRLRVPWHKHDLTLKLMNEAGTAVNTVVLARNIGRWGAALVHGRYVYPGTRCELILPALDGKQNIQAGEIMHSRHVQGMVHELGLRFDHPIDLAKYAELTPEQESRHLTELADDAPSEDAQPFIRSASRVLVVDDFASDRRLYNHWLSKAGMAVTSVTGSRAALEEVVDINFDGLVIDYHLGAETGVDVIRSLRSTQFVAPILAVSASDDGEAATAMLDAGADLFLAKPFTGEELISNIRAMMGYQDEADNAPIVSTLTDDPDMRPLLTEFTRRLTTQAEQLRDANARHDYDTLEQIARMLKGAGSGYGFEAISSHAAALQAALDNNAADMDEIRRSANDLLQLLHRVKMP